MRRERRFRLPFWPSVCEQMLRQMQDSGVISKCFEILFRPNIFKLAYLCLREAEPTPKGFLAERLAEQVKAAGVVSVCLENLADMFAFERCPEFVRLEKLVPMGWRRAELIALFPVAPAAQARVVVRRERCPASRTATAGRPTSPRTGSAHH